MTPKATPLTDAKIIRVERDYKGGTVVEEFVDPAFARSLELQLAAKDAAIAQEREHSIELLAALEHEQWMEWAKTVARSEPFLTDGRKERWAKCMVPYHMLTEEQKEDDRKWALKVIAALASQDDTGKGSG